MPDDYLKIVLKLPSAGPVLRQILGARTYYSHWRADLVSEARGKGADGGKSIRMLEPALEFQLASMSLDKIRTGPGKLLIEAAKLFAQELDFVTTDASCLTRRRRRIGSFGATIRLVGWKRSAEPRAV